MATPKNWPAPFPYLRAPVHDKSLTAAHLVKLKARPGPDSDVPIIPASATPAGPNGLVRIQPITEAAHPARGQCGLFAARDLEPGTFIMAYLGRVHSGAASAADSDYDLWLDRGADAAVDAAREGNEGRYVNDFRGVRERANAEFRTVWCERFGELCVGVWVIGGGGGGGGKKDAGKGKAKAKAKAKGGIKKGEEICVSYGKGFWGERKTEMEEEGEGQWGEDEAATEGLS